MTRFTHYADHNELDDTSAPRIEPTAPSWGVILTACAWCGADTPATDAFLNLEDREDQLCEACRRKFNLEQRIRVRNAKALAPSLGWPEYVPDPLEGR